MGYRKAFILIFVMLITACGDPYIAKIDQQLPLVEQRLQQLSQAIDNGQIRNANLIAQYADTISGVQPDLAPIVNELRKDATSQGPLYQSLVERARIVRQQPVVFASNEERYQELQNIYLAADKQLYSDALSDPLNVLADLSKGQLPRVNAMSKEQALQANGAEDFGTGSQLIGNPAYGQWQTDNSGMSFWQWYGMYALISNITDRVSYGRWGSRRGYSYYHDYGRSRFTSPNQMRQQQQVETRVRKSFANQGKTFNSAYSKNRVGSSGLSRQSVNAQQSSKFRRAGNNSKFAQRGNQSKYGNNSSFRDSRTKTTRSFRRGK
ncbi:hypothetical protein QWY77_04075 [Thalassotalea ponticola]|uniref:hypothetical protein n=1 Tax=Thalassotalea ponticola TaxID=1523392 RepID=UPI0025B3DE0B|nr:hypothetical protein [Thalassotalea ponticola]MDN3651944.1 hypothetical protein [Thalassotalea ponticola]